LVTKPLKSQRTEASEKQTPARWKSERNLRFGGLGHRAIAEHKGRASRLGGEPKSYYTGTSVLDEKVFRRTNSLVSTEWGRGGARDPHTDKDGHLPRYRRKVN